MKTVFNYAKAKGWRSGDNPVEGVSEVLPKHNGKKEHFAALPYAQVPNFPTALAEANVNISIKLAFEFLISQPRGLVRYCWQSGTRSTSIIKRGLFAGRMKRRRNIESHCLLDAWRSSRSGEQNI
jgi:hypothetical protein